MICLVMCNRHCVIGDEGFTTDFSMKTFKRPQPLSVYQKTQLFQLRCE